MQQKNGTIIYFLIHGAIAYQLIVAWLFNSRHSQQAVVALAGNVWGQPSSLDESNPENILISWQAKKMENQKVDDLRQKLKRGQVQEDIDDKHTINMMRTVPVITTMGLTELF